MNSQSQISESKVTERIQVNKETSIKRALDTDRLLAKMCEMGQQIEELTAKLQIAQEELLTRRAFDAFVKDRHSQIYQCSDYFIDHLHKMFAGWAVSQSDKESYISQPKEVAVEIVYTLDVVKEILNDLDKIMGLLPDPDLE